MGESLIVSVVPDETLAVLWGRDEQGRPFRLFDKEGYVTKQQRAEVLAAHPEAFYRLEIPRADVWQPPSERDAQGDWQRHTQAVHDSLQGLLDRQLSKLRGMVRTGRWVLGHVRARVTACVPVHNDWK